MPVDRSSSHECPDNNGLHSTYDDARPCSSFRSDGAPSSRLHHYPGIAAHCIIMNGETHFPTAMSCVSEGQRSDAATVCSGSVMEDIEVESVLSQEDDRTVQAGILRRAGSSGRMVEFAGAQQPQPQQHADSASTRKNVLQPTIPGIPLMGPNPLESQPESSSSLVPHNMGPPLSRALLLHKSGGVSGAGCTEGTVSRPSSVKSFGSHAGSEGAATNAHSDDCGESLDVETHSNHSHEDLLSVPHHHPIHHPHHPNEMMDPTLPVRNRRLALQPTSMPSFGSQPGSDDCGGSLDVETQSFETRSIHSQEEATLTDTVTLGELSVAASTITKTEALPTESYSSDNATFTEPGSEPASGRRSPGGTIYKGRGNRRYKGRYMNLTLKRFHQNGVDVEIVRERSDKGDKQRSEYGLLNTSRSHSPETTTRHGEHDELSNPPLKSGVGSGDDATGNKSRRKTYKVRSLDHPLTNPRRMENAAAPPSTSSTVTTRDGRKVAFRSHQDGSGGRCGGESSRRSGRTPPDNGVSYRSAHGSLDATRTGESRRPTTKGKRGRDSDMALPTRTRKR